ELEVLPRLEAEELAQALGVDRVKVARDELLFQALEPFHSTHERQRFLVGQRPRPVEEVAVAAREVLEVAAVVELLEERLEGVRRLGVLEVVVAQPAERLGPTVGEPVDEVALAWRA